MRKASILLVGMTLLVAACGGKSTPVATEAPAAPAAPATAAAYPMPTSAPAQAQPYPEVPTVAVPYPSPAGDAAAAPTAAAPYPVPTEVSVYGSPIIFKIVPDQSTVTYEVGETFLKDNRFATAIGETSQVSGTITLDPLNPQSAVIGPISIDISQFKSDSARRDGVIRDRFLESARYPIATFTPTKIEGLPATYQMGQPLTLKVTGDLTVKDVTKEVTFDVGVAMMGDSLFGDATTVILMSDFGVGPISIGGMLNTEDEVKIALKFVASP